MADYHSIFTSLYRAKYIIGKCKCTKNDQFKVSCFVREPERAFPPFGVLACIALVNLLLHIPFYLFLLIEQSVYCSFGLLGRSLIIWPLFYLLICLLRSGCVECYRYHLTGGHLAALASHYVNFLYVFMVLRHRKDITLEKTSLNHSRPLGINES